MFQFITFRSLNHCNYSPYGTLLDGRHGNETSYRYGYQGSEKDDEIKDISGSSYTTHFRMLDPRIGRWFSIDPVFQPWQSPYTSMDNNPILLNDPLGNVASGIDKGRGRKHTKKVNEDPETAAKKYATEHGYNNNNSKLVANEGGSITLQRKYRIDSKDNSEVTICAIMLFKPTNRYLNKQRKVYEAEKRRIHNNEHGMFRNLDFNHGIGGVNNTAFTEGSATAEQRAEWEYYRGKAQASADIVKYLFEFYGGLATGGTLYLEAGGAEVVTTAARYVSKIYGGMKGAASFYHRNIGMQGGYENVVKELINQTSNQAASGSDSYEVTGILYAAITRKDASTISKMTLAVLPTVYSIQSDGTKGGF